MKNVILRALCWPLYFGTLIALAVRGLWGEKDKRWVDGVLIVRLRRDSRPALTWYKRWAGTTFGYGIMLAPDANETVVDHEMVHVEQFEDATVGGFWLGVVACVIVHSLWGFGAWLACWMLAPWAVYFSGTIVAWLRSEPSAYRGNAWEEAAYNATAVKCRVPSP